MEIFSKPTQKPKEKRTIVENASIFYGVSPLRQVKELKFNEKTEVYEQSTSI